MGLRVLGSGRFESDAVDLAMDLNDPDSVRQALRDSKPQVIVHLAGVSFVAHGSRRDFYETNVIGTLNLLEGVKQSNIGLEKFLAASTAAVYGNRGVEVLTEDLVPEPNTDYGISKLAMEHLARLSVSEFPIVLMRLFNTTGVAQTERFVIPKMVRHFVDRSPTIELGNIDTLREYNDVRDIVEVVVNLLEKAEVSTTLNVCSGRGYSLRTVFEMLYEITGHSLEIEKSKKLIRPNEIQRLVGGTDLLRNAVGDIQFRDLRSTLEWMVQNS